MHRNAPEFVKINFNGVNFPINWDSLQSKITFKHLKIYDKVEVGGVTVSPFVLDHPGGCFGYRFEAGGKSVVIGVDGEYKRLSRDELGKDLRYYQNLDVLVFDSQYEMHELAYKFDWGHCSPTIGVDLALREGIRNLVFTHHDPWSDEKKIHKMNLDAKKHVSRQVQNYKDVWVAQPEGPRLHSAYDGLELDLSKL